MKNTIKQIFHSGKFVTGFVIFLAILLTIIIYPLVVAKDPLAMIGNGNFFKPGTYLSIQDTVNSGKTYKMNVDATASIVESKLTMDNRAMMAEWLEKYGGVDASEIDVTDAEGLIALAVKEKDNFETVTVTAKVARKDKDGKRVKEVVDGKKVTVYDEVQKEIKKDNSSRLHARRQMLKVLYPVTEVPTEAAGKKKNTKQVDMVDKLFTEIAPKYEGRNGGYTRIVKIGLRKGDNAMKVLLELV